MFPCEQKYKKQGNTHIFVQRNSIKVEKISIKKNAFEREKRCQQQIA
jgi:hypothetical protein